MNETQQQLPVQPPLVTAPVAVLACAITILGDGDVSERPGGVLKAALENLETLPKRADAQAPLEL